MGLPFVLRLYVAGSGINSAQAVSTLTSLCRRYLPDRHELEIIDLLQEPKRALKDGVAWAPALVRVQPGPTVIIPLEKETLERDFLAALESGNQEKTLVKEVATLLATLRETEHRLETITAYGADAVIDSAGRPYFLGPLRECTDPDDSKRPTEAGLLASQAILDSISAHVALLDREGRIILVNESWRQFSGAGAAWADGGYGIGRNYLEVCERAEGECAEEAHRVAAGIRSILDGKATEFSLEYPCHSPHAQRWYRLLATPLRGPNEGVVVMHFNVTEAKVSEEKLRRSEALLRVAGEAAQLGGWTLELAENRLTWSDEVRSIHEVGPGPQPTPQEALSYIAPEWREMIQQAFADCIEKGKPFDVKLEIITPKGRRKWVKAIGTAERCPSGTITRVQGAFQDIGKQQAAEEALRASEERFARAFEQAPIGKALVSPKGQWLKVNRALCHLLGYSAEELLATTFQKLTHPDDLEEDLQQMQRMLAGEIQLHEMTKRYFHRQGHIVRVLLRYSLVRDAKGDPVYFVSQLLDITERERAMEQIREQAALLDQARDAIVVRDLQHRVTFWNKGAEELYGWKVEEAMGRSISELFEQPAEPFQKAMEKLLVEGEWNGELEQVTRLQGSLTVEGRWTLVRDEQGVPKSVLTFNTDISERKRIEAQFLRTQRMESIGTLASGIAHDLNNVLAPILIAVELLDDKVTDEQSHALLSTLRVSSLHGADLVRQVLSFARGLDGQRIPVHLEHLMRDMQKIVRDTFPKNISFNFSAARDLWMVTGDPTQLHQVFMNMCVNARDAMPAGGTLTITMANVVFDEVYAGMDADCRPGRYVLITIEDTGMGIPREAQAKIFEPFFTTKTNGAGTGLGLSTTMAVIKGHGGFINFASEPGRGTSFRLYLPGSVDKYATKSLCAPERPPSHGRGELILVVDDEAGVRTVLERALQNYGYRCLLASHGAQAVSLYAQQQGEIDVVLTDMSMPVMDGPATITALRSINPQVKIIACSGLTTELGALGAGGDSTIHLLRKPFTAEVLLKVLAETLGTA